MRWIQRAVAIALLALGLGASGCATDAFGQAGPRFHHLLNGGGAAAPFTPASLACMADAESFWTDTTLETDFSNTDPVDVWTDFSGNGNHLVQGTGAKQPLWADNIQNGLDMILFDGVDDILTLATSSFEDYMVAVVAKTDASPKTSVFVWEHRVDANNSSSIWHTTGFTIYEARAATVSSYNANTAAWLGNNQTRVIIRQYDGTHAGNNIRVDGANLAKTAVGSGAPGVSARSATFVLSGRDGGTFTNDLYVGAIAACPRADITGDELTNLEAYYNALWSAY